MKEWKKKMQCVHTREFDVAVKKNEMTSLAGKEMKPEIRLKKSRQISHAFSELWIMDFI